MISEAPLHVINCRRVHPVHAKTKTRKGHIAIVNNMEAQKSETGALGLPRYIAIGDISRLNVYIAKGDTSRFIFSHIACTDVSKDIQNFFLETCRE